jgi:hypothetical protein
MSCPWGRRILATSLGRMVHPNCKGQHKGQHLQQLLPEITVPLRTCGSQSPLRRIFQSVSAILIQFKLYARTLLLLLRHLHRHLPRPQQVLPMPTSRSLRGSLRRRMIVRSPRRSRQLCTGQRAYYRAHGDALTRHGGWLSQARSQSELGWYIAARSSEQSCWARLRCRTNEGAKGGRTAARG